MDHNLKEIENVFQNLNQIFYEEYQSFNRLQGFLEKKNHFINKLDTLQKQEGAKKKPLTSNSRGKNQLHFSQQLQKMYDNIIVQGISLDEIIQD
ncbi:hypothetical protein M0813_01257 [Anaeramoeba flamelloides]|uniref:Uncharacterized protein n=1 Tax=Anaeramoeba flamelloides TaxID=1746091 RepID=A0AAV7YQP3_9EUKA|nr:hypothetical protein M0812_20743 [Anaeramoeba flamelloides]KAJ6253211.1 hypothetical protein M0813_01257 [Anaeramoeba flamelloides]